MQIVIVRGEQVTGITCAYLARGDKAVIYMPEDQITRECATALADVLTEAFSAATPLRRAAAC